MKTNLIESILHSLTEENQNLNATARGLYSITLTKEESEYLIKLLKVVKEGT